MVRFSLYNITRKQRIFIAVIALAIAAIAIAAISVCCSHHTYPRELVVADSLCESNPDSAEALLRRMPDSVLAAKPDRMYYDLLRIKASNNLYEPQKDSAIFRIVDFLSIMATRRDSVRHIIIRASIMCSTMMPHRL